MQIEVTAHNVRTLADSIQKSLGTSPEDAIKRSKAYELLAALCNQPNWDTLSSVLNAEASRASRPEANASLGRYDSMEWLTQPVHVYGTGRSTDEYSKPPKWVRFLCNGTFLNRVNNFVKNIGQGPAAMTLAEFPGAKDEEIFSISAAPNTNVRWHESNPSEPMNIWGEEVVVGHGSFWLRGHPKHANYLVEMSQMRIDDLVEILKHKGSSEYFAWASETKLLYSSSGGIAQLASDLFASGELSEDEAERLGADT